jgi:hypothetical protein
MKVGVGITRQRGALEHRETGCFAAEVAERLPVFLHAQARCEMAAGGKTPVFGGPSQDSIVTF